MYANFQGDWLNGIEVEYGGRTAQLQLVLPYLPRVSSQTLQL